MLVVAGVVVAYVNSLLFSLSLLPPFPSAANFAAALFPTLRGFFSFEVVVAAMFVLSKTLKTGLDRW